MESGLVRNFPVCAAIRTIQALLDGRVDVVRATLGDPAVPWFTAFLGVHYLPGTTLHRHADRCAPMEDWAATSLFRLAARRHGEGDPLAAPVLECVADAVAADETLDAEGSWPETGLEPIEAEVLRELVVASRRPDTAAAVPLARLAGTLGVEVPPSSFRAVARGMSAEDFGRVLDDGGFVDASDPDIFPAVLEVNRLRPCRERGGKLAALFARGAPLFPARAVDSPIVALAEAAADAAAAADDDADSADDIVVAFLAALQPAAAPYWRRLPRREPEYREEISRLAAPLVDILQRLKDDGAVDEDRAEILRVLSVWFDGVGADAGDAAVIDIDADAPDSPP